MMDNMLKCLRMIHAAYDADGADLSAWTGRAADELERLAALADGEGTRAVEYLRRARKAEAEVESLKLGEEGAKEAFGAVVQDKRDLEAESKHRNTLLEAAYADIRRALASKNEAETEMCLATQEADELRALNRARLLGA